MNVPIIYPLCILWIVVFMMAEEKLEKVGLKRRLATISLGIMTIVSGIFLFLCYDSYLYQLKAGGISFKDYMLQRKIFLGWIGYFVNFIFACIFASLIRWNNQDVDHDDKDLGDDVLDTNL